MTIGSALLQGTKILEKAGVSPPRLTAEVLLAHAVRQNRVWLYAHSDEELREVWWIHFGRYLHERMQGKPTQYITRVQEFYGRDFRVTPAVLIPRPETEHLIEAVLEKSRDAKTTLDIGTGSGAIAVTLALELGKPVIATDICFDALTVAAHNATNLGAPVNFLACDLGSALPSNHFDFVVSNPPYIAESDQPGLQKEVRDYEPEIALFAGPTGLDLYRRLIPDAWRLLRPDGWLVMELGHKSAEPVRDMLGAWKQVEVRMDLAGLPRVMLARKP